MSDFVNSHKKIIIIALIGFAILFIASGVKQKRQEEESERLHEEYQKQQQEAMENSEEVSDNILLQMQDNLIETYGKLPNGYIWDLDGSLLSLGDKSMSAEDVVYAYLNGIRSLAFFIKTSDRINFISP